MGITGKPLRFVLLVDQTGSFTGIQYVHEALRQHKECEMASKDRQLRFLTNIDMGDFWRAVEGLNFEETLVVINSTGQTGLDKIPLIQTLVKWFETSYMKQTKGGAIR